jgi:hypothetical protein
MFLYLCSLVGIRRCLLGVLVTTRVQIAALTGSHGHSVTCSSSVTTLVSNLDKPLLPVVVIVQIVTARRGLASRVFGWAPAAAERVQRVYFNSPITLKLHNFYNLNSGPSNNMVKIRPSDCG